MLFLSMYSSKMITIIKIKPFKFITKLDKGIVISSPLLSLSKMGHLHKLTSTIKSVIIWDQMLFVTKTKDLLRLHLIILTQEKIPEYLFLGWVVISIRIILFPTQEDCHDILHFQSEAYGTMLKTSLMHEIIIFRVYFKGIFF